MKVALDSPDDRKMTKKKENRCYKTIFKITQKSFPFPFLNLLLPFSNGT